MFTNINSKTLAGIIFVMLAVFFFCFQDVQVKYLSAFYSIFIIIWVKSFVQFLLVLITLLIKEKKIFFKSLNYKS